MRDESGRRLSMAVIFHRPQSIRLWFSSRRWKNKDGHISSLSLDQLLKTKVAIRAEVVPAVERWRDDAGSNEDMPYAKRVEEQNNMSSHTAYEHQFHRFVRWIRMFRNRLTNISVPCPGFTASRIVRKRLSTGTIQVSRRATCNQCPHPGRPCPFQQYNVAQPKSPIPPRRSSSLPKDSRMIEAICNPSAPLATFRLSQQDGCFFKYMLTGSLNKLEVFSATNLWPMVLETFQTEPCIRHIMLGTAMIHRSRSDSNMSRHRDAQQLASRHYSNAVRLLSKLLSPTRNGSGGESQKVILLTTFLLAVFDLLRRKDDRASWWVQSGSKLLGIAPSSLGTNTVKSRPEKSVVPLIHGYKLMDVNLKIKNMKTFKKRERSLGKRGGASGSRGRTSNDIETQR
jgi:hypothetical protein